MYKILNKKQFVLLKLNIIWAGDRDRDRDKENGIEGLTGDGWIVSDDDDGLQWTFKFVVKEIIFFWL